MPAAVTVTVVMPASCGRQCISAPVIARLLLLCAASPLYAHAGDVGVADAGTGDAYGQ